MKTLVLLTTSAWLALPLIAQPPPPHGNGGHRRGPPETPEFQKERPQRDPEKGPPRDRGPALDRYLSVLKEKNPEEFERLSKMRAEDPEAFRQALRGKLTEARERFAPGNDSPRRPFQPLADEVRAVKESATPEDRAIAVATLRARVAELLDQRLEMRERRMKAIQVELEKLQEQHRLDLERREVLIDEHLERILENRASPPPEER